MKKMIDNEKAMKLLQVADKVDFESDEMVIEGKLNANGKITANNGVELAEGTILTVPSASNVFIKDESTNLDQELYAKQDKLVSGTNIKTINGNSVLGSGNIEISGGGDTARTYGLAIQLDDQQDGIASILGMTETELEKTKETIIYLASELGGTPTTFEEAAAVIKSAWPSLSSSVRTDFVRTLINASVINGWRFVFGYTGIEGTSAGFAHWLATFVNFADVQYLNSAGTYVSITDAIVNSTSVDITAGDIHSTH